MPAIRSCFGALCLLICATCLLPAQAKDTQALEQAVGELAKSGFQGAILAARGDKLIYLTTLGNFGDVSRTFRYASLTKEMTAIMIMQEVDAGKLQLDRPLEQYWPDYPNAEARKATLRQLMMHYSGLYNENAQPAFHMLDSHSGDNMQAFATGLCAGTVNSAPGTRFDYNNCDYIVLGALLEKTTKKSFSQLLKERIFTPSGMTHSGLYDAAMPDNPAHAHGILNGQPEPTVNFASYGAAGGSYGTLQDLLAFDRAFIKGKLISAEARKEMTRPNSTGGALGVWVYPFSGADANKPVTIVERQGWIAGVRILNLVDLKNGNILIIVSLNGDLDMTQTWNNQGPAAGLLKALILY